MEGQTLSPFHWGPGLSFHVLETLSVSVFLCVHVGGESGLGEPTTQIPHLVLRTIPGLHWVWMHVVLAFLYPCLLTLLISLFFSQPSALPRGPSLFQPQAAAPQHIGCPQSSSAFQ